MDVKVNAAEWAALPGDHKEQISKILATSFKGAVVVPDPQAPLTATVRGAAAGWDPFNDVKKALCIAACTAAEAAAIAACQGVPPPGDVICSIAAHAAGEGCRRSCG